MIAVGSDDANPSGGGKVQIYEYSDNTRYPFETIQFHGTLIPGTIPPQQINYLNIGVDP